MTNSKKTAVILLNLGGPDKLSSVKPFLFNLFNDKAIISLPQPFRFLLAKLISSRRAHKAQKIYEQIGGKSPLLEITRAQADSLNRELSFFGEFKVFVSMRYWHPMSKQVVAEVLDYNPKQVILLPLYPQFSTSTTESSLTDFVSQLRLQRSDIVIKQVCCYKDDPQFVLSHANLIKNSLQKFADKKMDEFRFLFSAHGLPQKLIDQGDPYVFQVEQSTKAIVKILQKTLDEKNIDFKVCYQSKVGPLQWTSPSLDHEIRRAALDKKNVVIVPISFVSEHSETLVELDIDYKKLAEDLAIKHYVRVPALNLDGHFIKSLTQICRSVASQDGTWFSGGQTKLTCSPECLRCPIAILR